MSSSVASSRAISGTGIPCQSTSFSTGLSSDSMPRQLGSPQPVDQVKLWSVRRKHRISDSTSAMDTLMFRQQCHAQDTTMSPRLTLSKTNFENARCYEVWFTVACQRIEIILPAVCQSIMHCPASPNPTPAFHTSVLARTACDSLAGTATANTLVGSPAGGSMAGFVHCIRV